MGRPKKSDLKGRDTGELIYESAVTLMFADGFHATSLRDVARVVGVQMSTLYYYYDSKQSLLLSVMTRTMDGLIEAARSATIPSQSPVDKLEAVIASHIEFHARRPKEARVADTELRSLDADNLRAVVEMRDEYEKIFRDIMTEGQATGDLAELDIPIVVRSLLVSLTDVAVWFKPRGRLTLAEITEIYRALLLDGMLTRPPRSR